MLRTLTVIGEASSKVSAELKQPHGEVPWQRVSGVRHRIVHDYSGLDYELLWQVVTVFAPKLAEQVAAIFRAEFPDLDRSSTVGDAQSPQLADSTQGDAFRREILVSQMTMKKARMALVYC